MYIEGIVILVTKDVVGKEYRVAPVSSIDALYGVFDDRTGQWTGDAGVILDNFAECDVYTDEEAAMTYAAQLAEDQDYLDSGVMVLRDFEDKEFNLL